MEGRHCFGHLTIEENLLTGAFTRRVGRGPRSRDLETIYAYFPRLKERRGSLAGYTSGGEQQMCAIGRAMMSKPQMILLDEPSMGLAPQIVEEIFEIVRDLNSKENVSFLLAEQNTNMALRYATYGYIMENGRIVLDGEAKALARERGREGILSRRRRRRPQELPRRQALQAAQALARLTQRCMLAQERAKRGVRMSGALRRSRNANARSRARRRCIAICAAFSHRAGESRPGAAGAIEGRRAGR
jgi:ABC-type multidrug transport system ATPase subunit